MSFFFPFDALASQKTIFLKFGENCLLQCEICYMGTGLRNGKHANIIITGRGVVLAIFYVFYPIFLRSSRETFVSPHYYFTWPISPCNIIKTTILLTHA
jgi:hypothetical protein